MNTWIYNEFKHCGVDYTDPRQAANYDSQHGKFRNYEQEFNDSMEFLSLKNTHDLNLIDLGCGTGATTLYASKQFKKVYAVDVSEVMISQARKKAVQASINNIEFVNAGFLTYEHKEAPVDLVVTKHAFHHLPDFWKQIALLNINSMLKPGGHLYLCDVVFSFEPEEYENKIKQWVNDFELKTNPEFTEEVKTHIRDEFSTYDWILEAMLKKAGFAIEKNRTFDGFIMEYCCKKIG